VVVVAVEEITPTMSQAAAVQVDIVAPFLESFLEEEQLPNLVLALLLQQDMQLL
jgi:hypothetical protein